MDVGSELRQRREERGLSLQQVSKTTKISVSILRAIEDNDLARLPAGVFTRGFLRAYAHEVGLDAGETIQRYAAQVAERDAAIGESARTSPAGGHHTDDDAEPGEPNGFFERSPALVTVLAVLALAAYLALGRRLPDLYSDSAWHPPPSTDSARAEPTADAVPAAATSASRETASALEGVATAGSSEAVPSQRETDSVLRFDLEPRGLCWVEARADGRQVAYRLMHAGERLTIDAQDELVLRIGDPANLALSVNGIPGKPLGRAGTPMTIRITRQNYPQFLNQ